MQFKTSYEELKTHTDSVELKNQDLLAESQHLRESTIAESRHHSENHQRQIDQLQLALQKAENEKAESQAELSETKEQFQAQVLELRHAHQASQLE